jgi:hypothetical protein
MKNRGLWLLKPESYRIAQVLIAGDEKYYQEEEI